MLIPKQYARLAYEVKYKTRGPLVKAKKSFKGFFYFSSDRHFIQQSGMV